MAHIALSYRCTLIVTNSGLQYAAMSLVLFKEPPLWFVRNIPRSMGMRRTHSLL